MSDDIIPVDSFDFDEKIESGICLVFFYAEWCVQSRGLQPILAEIADEYYEKIRVYSLDVEQSPDIVIHCKISATPTVIIFKNGKISEKISGANPPSVYSEAIEELLEE